MSSKWRKVRLGDLATITRGSSPRPIMDWVSSTGTPWVKISDATSETGRYISSTKECIKNEARSKSVVVVPGDLIVSNSATPGLPKFMNIEACIHDGWLLLRNFKDVLPEFLYYMFINDRKKLVEKGSGSVFTNLKTDILKNHEIMLPSLNEQKWIAEILRQMDDLIEINGSVSSTLERFASVIFKSWFIDFDPVKAKIDGEQPVGMDDATAALFPNSMEDSEFGLIPKGWKKVPLYEFAAVRNGAPFASKLFNSKREGLPLIRIRDLKTQATDTWSTENHPKGFTVSAGQLLIGMDGEFNPTIWCGEESLVNQRICLLENIPEVSAMYLYFALIPIMKRIENGAIGTTVIHLGKSDFDKIQIIDPGVQLLENFRNLMEPLLREIVELAEESRKLKKIRDLLLPRLISGELQIPKEMLVS
jgi:type I restriction enzyme S subunit